MTNYSLSRIVRAADGAIPQHNPRHFNHARMRAHREMLLVGIGYEMAVIKPSYPELAAAIGCSHHSCMEWLKAWREIDWRERYGWLKLVDAALSSEKTAVDVPSEIGAPE